jgi:hypothetical protein
MRLASAPPSANESTIMETLLTCKSREAAEHLETRLKMAGFARTSLVDESNLQRFVYLTKPIGAFKVVVADQDLEAAKRELHTWELLPDADLAEVIYCPECRCSNVEYPQSSRKPIVPTVAMDLLMVTGLLEREFYCRECHHTWADSLPEPEA